MAPLVYYSLLALAFILIAFKLLLKPRSFKNLPPFPPTHPIIGNLHHLKPPLHRSLHNLSQKYGPIYSLWFGSRLVVVITSPTIYHECITKYDTILANRPHLLTGKYLFYNYTTLGSASYGEHWRNLRRITTTDVLSTQRLNSFFDIRRDETVRVIYKLAQDSAKGFTQVQIRPRLTEMTFNNMMRMISGKRYYGEDIDVSDAEEAKQFRDIITEMLSLLGANNKGDFMPFLRWFDFDGLEKRLKKISKRADAFLQGLLDEHRSGKHSGANTMIQHLLTLQKTQPEYYSDYIIKGLIQAMLLAGTDTTAVTMEWVMSTLLNHPEILKKAKDELNTHIGKDRLVDESDIPNLPYLQNIIYETLRLYSPAPMLLPHFSSDECNVGGYTIPRDTIVLVNAWAIQRDPEIWGDDASSFKPERFEKEGETNKLIAFGLGRRACPGLGLAHRTMGLTVGLLIQCFDWKRLTDEEIDMRESKGVAMPKLIPLEAMCKALPISKKLM